jgi:hypothetical protein
LSRHDVINTRHPGLTRALRQLGDSNADRRLSLDEYRAGRRQRQQIS